MKKKRASKVFAPILFFVTVLLLLASGISAILGAHSSDRPDPTQYRTDYEFRLFGQEKAALIKRRRYFASMSIAFEYDSEQFEVFGDGWVQDGKIRHFDLESHQAAMSSSLLQQFETDEELDSFLNLMGFSLEATFKSDLKLLLIKSDDLESFFYSRSDQNRNYYHSLDADEVLIDESGAPIQRDPGAYYLPIGSTYQPALPGAVKFGGYYQLQDKLKTVAMDTEVTRYHLDSMLRPKYCLRYVTTDPKYFDDCPLFNGLRLTAAITFYISLGFLALSLLVSSLRGRSFKKSGAADTAIGQLVMKFPLAGSAAILAAYGFLALLLWLTLLI